MASLEVFGEVVDAGGGDGGSSAIARYVRHMGVIPSADGRDDGYGYHLGDGGGERHVIAFECAVAVSG